MPKKNAVSGAWKYLRCSTVTIIICENDRKTEVTAHRYIGQMDGSDLIVYQHPKDGEWEPAIMITDLPGPRKKDASGNLTFKKSGQVKIVIIDGEQQAVATAYHYICDQDDSDLYVYQHPIGREWSPMIMLTVLPVPDWLATCEDITQPANAMPDFPVQSRISDPSAGKYASKIYTCTHLPQHLALLGVAECRTALGEQLCTQQPLPHPPKGKDKTAGKKSGKKAAAKAARKAEKKSQKKK